MPVFRIAFRSLLACTVAAGFTVFNAVSGWVLSLAATGILSPLGDGDADPRGRGGPIFDDAVGVFIPALFGLLAGWIVWLATDRKNWSIDLLVATPIFLLAGPIASANWARADVIFTRDAQALLNVLLVASGVAVTYALQKSIKGTSSTFVLVLGSTVLAICIFAFVAIPFWYTLSYLSAKLGAGKLDSLDAAAKAIGAAGSLLAVLGIQWKEGRLDLIGGSGRKSASR